MPVSRALGMSAVVAVAVMPVLLAAVLLHGSAPVDPGRVYLVMALMTYVQGLVALAVRLSGR
ncbi:hypothetical protein ACIRST_38900 [Kitasatospora sp. NPDC101447]|uniref:hypothetical protein n=1 Tax=Kitasatospora sp. NPDC101447 TaxID=3364102 RepID=UPI0037FBF06F